MITNLQQIRISLERKLQITNYNCKLIVRYVQADLTDDEIWVLAVQKANASRVSNEWEGFYVTDFEHLNHTIQRYDSLKERIEQFNEQ